MFLLKINLKTFYLIKNINNNLKNFEQCTIIFLWSGWLRRYMYDYWFFYVCNYTVRSVKIFHYRNQKQNKTLLDRFPSYS